MKIQKILLLACISIGPSAFAGEPVTPAQNQAALLTSSDPLLATNKHLVYDFWRTVLIGRHLDQAAAFLQDDYVQHNPNVPTGLKGFLDYFSHLGPPRAIPNEIPGLVTIRAEGDLVTVALVDEHANPSGGTYTTTWFDMFRIQGGKIAEHWDCATIDPQRAGGRDSLK